MAEHHSFATQQHDGFADYKEKTTQDAFTALIEFKKRKRCKGV